MKNIETKINEIVGNVTKIESIGNHNLKRHLVYLVYTHRCKYVIKFYNIANKWQQEIAALKLLKDTNILVPNIISYGKDDTSEWILYEYIEGITLDKIQENLSDHNLMDIYCSAGEQLGKIHSLKLFKYYGNMDEELTNIDKHLIFREYFEKEISRIFTNLNNDNHEEIALINQAKKRLIKLLKCLDYVYQSRLCHNDFGKRNIIINKTKETYKVACIIDFEQSSMSDVDRELIIFHNKLNNFKLSQKFQEGYEKHMNINLEKINEKKQIYLLYRGLYICSWSKTVDKQHYEEGVQLLKKVILSHKTL